VNRIFKTVVNKCKRKMLV